MPAWLAWAVEAYGTITAERKLDGVEEACIAELKAKGAIR